MNVAIDTNRLTDFFRGDGAIRSALRRPSSILIPFVVIGELRAGFLCGRKSLENERALVKFITSPRCEILFPDEDTTHHYARIFQQLRVAGTPIPSNDLWIAALCIQHDLHLLTRDEHFKKLPQLSSSDE